MKFKPFLIAASVLLLAGCAEAATESGTQPADPVASESVEGDKARFESIAQASCERAMQQGVEEATSNGSYRQVMIPKDQALDGYSAAWEDTLASEIGLIWEADAFLSCAAAMTLALAEEAGEEPVWVVTEQDEGFELFQDFGEFGTQTIVFTVTNDLFSAAAIVEGESFVIDYGPDIETAKNLIAKAVIEFGG